MAKSVWVSAVCAVLLCGWRADAQMPPARVRVATVVQRELSTGQTFVGTVVPLRSSTVSSTVADRVVEFLVEEGDSVEKGQPLARLRTKHVEIELSGAKAELELRKQELAELVSGSRPEEIRQAQARMLAAKALMEFTQSRLKRTETLFTRKAISEDTLQEDTSAAENARQKYEETKAAWDLAVAGPRKEKIEQARSRMAVQQEEVRRLEDELAEHTVVAPFSGYVTAEHTEVGQWVAAGSPVVDVVDVDHVEVEVAVLESCVSQLKLGTQVRVEIGALPGRLWTGRIVAIVPQADVRSRSFPVKVRLENRTTSGEVPLKPGMFARVVLPVGRKSKACLVPKDAVVLGGRLPVVYAAVPAPKAEPPVTATARLVPVELGVAVDELIEVRGPLKPTRFGEVHARHDD